MDIDERETKPKTEQKGHPKAGSEDVGKYFYKRFQIAKSEKDRLNLPKKFMINYELFRGKHFKNDSSKVPLVPVNIHYVAVSRTKANLTDQNPRFEVTAKDENADKGAPILNAVALDWWERTRQQVTLSETVQNSEIYGTSVEKMAFDPSLCNGLGDVSTVIVDPFKFFPWPGIRDIQKMPYMFEVEILELSEIRRRWPETGEQVVAEDEWARIVGKDREKVRGGTTVSISSESNLPSNYVAAGSVDKVDTIERAMVIECWVRDYSTETVTEPQPMLDMDGNPMLDEMGQPMSQDVSQERQKYPGNIRCIHIANEGKVVLDDVPNPSVNPNSDPNMVRETYLYDRYPYVKNDSNTDTSSFWGFSTIEQIEILGRELNKKISQVAAFIDKTVKPTLIYPGNIGLEEHMITNEAGLKWRVTNAAMSQHVRYLQMPPLPPDFYQYIELLLRLVDMVTGIHDVTQGRAPEGVAAASAIIALQEKAETIFREKIRNLTLLLEERGRMFISHVQNWYTEERKLKVSGKLKQEYTDDYINFRGSEQFGQYGFEVATGSTMPKSMFVRQQQAQSLYTIRAIDQRALLEQFDWPDKDEVIARMMMGPLGQLKDRLLKAKVLPPEAINLIEQIGMMPEKDFKKLTQLTSVPTGGQTAPAGRQTPSGTGGLGTFGGVK